MSYVVPVQQRTIPRQFYARANTQLKAARFLQDPS